MNIIKTDFEDLLIIEHDIYHDKRGCFKVIFNQDILNKKLGYEIKFCQENSVLSSHLVLRGLHYQKDPFAQSKLIYVDQGKILDVAVDLRINSKTYGKYFSYTLSSKLNQSIFIPKGFAHGYLTLSDSALVKYMVDNEYNKNSEDGICFNDKSLNIDWGVDLNTIIISEKDKKLKDYNWE